MALIEMLTPEVLTAIGVSFGAVFGGVAALIGELRKPPRSHEDQKQAEKEASDASAALLEEEVEHLTRTMWIIERRLSDHLVRIEGRLSLTQEDEEPPPRTARRKPAAPAIEPARPTQQDPMRDE
jgi:hypothetical protein